LKSEKGALLLAIDGSSLASVRASRSRASKMDSISILCITPRRLDGAEEGRRVLLSDAAGRKPTTSSFSSFFLISIYVHVAGMRAKADDSRSPPKIEGNCKRERER